MWLYCVRKQEKGFTLIEMLAVTVMVGVIAAIAAPNLLGLLNRNRLNQAISDVEGALKEAQKIATRNSRNCTISINAATNTISNNGANDTCLLTTRDISNISANLNLVTSRNTITFSGKGNVTLVPEIPVIVVSLPNSGTNQQTCVVIQNTLGSIRRGNYVGTIPATPIPGDCQ